MRDALWIVLVSSVCASGVTPAPKVPAAAQEDWGPNVMDEAMKLLLVGGFEKRSTSRRSALHPAAFVFRTSKSLGYNPRPCRPGETCG